MNAVGWRQALTRRRCATATLFVDRRESAEIGPARSEALETWIRGRPHQGGARASPDGAAAGRSSPDELTVFRSLGIAVEDPSPRSTSSAAPGRRGVDRRSSFDPAREDPRRARAIAGAAVRTPLVRLNAPEAPAEIWLKLENLQPIGSFKIRGADNAMRARVTGGARARASWTASAGQHGAGRGLGGAEARRAAARSSAPEHAPADQDRGDRAARRPRDQGPVREWWQTRARAYPGVEGLFIHPVEDEPASWPATARSGSRSSRTSRRGRRRRAVRRRGADCGIACAVSALRPETQVFAVEVETAAPFAASLAAGAPRRSTTRRRSSTASAARSCCRDVAARERAVDGALVVSLAEIAAAMRLLAERARVIAEGAGRAPVAAALAGRAGRGKIVCIVPVATSTPRGSASPGRRDSDVTGYAQTVAGASTSACGCACSTSSESSRARQATVRRSCTSLPVGKRSSWPARRMPSSPAPASCCSRRGVRAVGDLRLVAVDAPVEGEIERERVVSASPTTRRSAPNVRQTFRVLHQGELTQFIGNVEPCRAPDHSHPYDEVGYIVEGHGRRAYRRRAGAAAGGSASTCPRLRPLHREHRAGSDADHGVFDPAGSPKQRS